MVLAGQRLAASQGSVSAKRRMLAATPVRAAALGKVRQGPATPPGRALASWSLSRGRIRSGSWRTSHPGPPEAVLVPCCKEEDLAKPWRELGRAASDWLVEACFPAHDLPATRQDWQAPWQQRILGQLLLLARTVLVQKGMRRWNSPSQEEVGGARRDGCTRPDGAPIPKTVSLQVRPLEQKAVERRFPHREGFQ